MLASSYVNFLFLLLPISLDTQNSKNSPGSFSTGRQTTTTTTSQDSGGGKPTISKNRKEFYEQRLHNQSHLPSEEDAKPNDKISAELDYSLRRLINLDVFRQVLDDPNSRHAFRQAIIQGLSSSSTPPTPSLIKLDLWADCRGLTQMLHLLKIGTCGLSGQSWFYSCPPPPITETQVGWLKIKTPDSKTSRVVKRRGLFESGTLADCIRRDLG